LKIYQGRLGAVQIRCNAVIVILLLQCSHRAPVILFNYHTVLSATCILRFNYSFIGQINRLIDERSSLQSPPLYGSDIGDHERGFGTFGCSRKMKMLRILTRLVVETSRDAVCAVEFCVGIGKRT